MNTDKNKIVVPITCGVGYYYDEENGDFDEAADVREVEVEYVKE